MVCVNGHPSVHLGVESSARKMSEKVKVERGGRTDGRGRSLVDDP